MRPNTRILPFIAQTMIALSIAACSKAPTPATGASATVTLKDGSSFSGTVTTSDTSAITLLSSTGESRTYPMAQVSQVQYANSGASGVATTSGAVPTQAPPAAVTGNTAPPPPETTPVPAPVAPFKPAAEFRTIAAGTTIEVRNNQTIDSQTASTGQTYSGVVAHDVTDASGAVAIPRGSSATLVILNVDDQGKIQGRSELALDVNSVTVAGRTYRLETSDFVEKGTAGVGKNKRTGEFIGGGSALGGIIGAIAGGGKGAAIGALSGAAAGTATQAATRGHAVRVPAETVLSFRLEAPIHIREMR